MNVINQTTETAPTDAVRPHPRNPRQGDVGAIHESITANGFYGTIIAQKSTGYILAGNHRHQAAVQAGAVEIPVTWVDVDDDHALRILLADNRTNDLATYDDAALAEILKDIHEEHGTLAGTGYDGDALDDLLGDLKQEEEKYTRKIQPPIYEPQAESPPPVQTLLECDKAEELKAEINDTPDLPDDVRAFLLAAAERHTRFRFDNIAEYYAHAPAHIQQLMESSALVIIDFDQAIEKGYVKMTEEILSYVQTE